MVKDKLLIKYCFCSQVKVDQQENQDLLVPQDQSVEDTVEMRENSSDLDLVLLHQVSRFPETNNCSHSEIKNHYEYWIRLRIATRKHNNIAFNHTLSHERRL